MPRSFILVDDALIDHCVDDWHCVPVGCSCSVFFTFFDFSNDSFNIGAHFRTKPLIVEPFFFGLSCSFSC